MSFPTSAYLRGATSRAKSDVANKLVGMLLHAVSRRIGSSLRLAVTDATYADDVEATFGSDCCYCCVPLEKDRVCVEHLDGMNRFRLGLHIPGNVIVSCKRCNGEKRRDDQVPSLILADSGWESFLSHDSTRCGHGCPTCAYWATVWPDLKSRGQNMKAARGKIISFRSRYPESLDWSHRAQTLLREAVDTLYRECQEFAAAEIDKVIAETLPELARVKADSGQSNPAYRGRKATSTNRGLS
jgi:hypothetical protein